MRPVAMFLNLLLLSVRHPRDMRPLDTVQKAMLLDGAKRLVSGFIK
jgi:hypothetical protein